MYRCFEANLEGLEISGCQDEQILRIFLVWKSWDCHSVIRSELTKLLRACEEVPVPQKWARDAQEIFFVGNCLEGWYNPWTFLVVKNPHLKGPFIRHEWKVKGAYNDPSLWGTFGFLDPRNFSEVQSSLALLVEARERQQVGVFVFGPPFFL